MKKENKIIVSAEHRSKGLESLAAGMAPLIKKILGEKGLAEINILSAWPEIVGTELAQFSQPQKIEFKKGERSGGTLHLMTAGGAFALEIQHKSALILEQINTFFGYNAVCKIKFIQNDSFIQTQLSSKIDHNTEKKLVTPKEQTYIREITEDIQNPELKTRLRSLGNSIMKNQK